MILSRLLINLFISIRKLNSLYQTFPMDPSNIYHAQSAQKISFRSNRLNQVQTIATGRNRAVDIQKNQDNVLNRDRQNDQERKQNRSGDKDLDDDFEFISIDPNPVNQVTGINREYAKNFQTRPNDKNTPQNIPNQSEKDLDESNSEVESLEDIEQIIEQSNTEELRKPIRAKIQNQQQQPNRLPEKQQNSLEDNLIINEKPKSFGNLEQSNEISYSAFIPADYTKDKDLSYAAHLQNQINRKKKPSSNTPHQLQIVSPAKDQNTIRESVCINNLFSDEFFAGRLSVLWLFIIGKGTQQLVTRIHEIYRTITDRDYEMPLCRNTKEALQFFKAQNSFFKVIVDLDNAPELISQKELETKILSIYLYNNDPDHGLSRSISIKASSKKVRGFYKDLSPLLKRAQSDIQNGNKFVRQNEGSIEEIKFQSSLPTFIKLNFEDKSEITTYRINLYGAIKLTDEKERMEKLEDFVNLVKRVYLKDKTEMNYLSEYLNSIDHLKCVPNEEKKHFDILRFYVQETFYYKLTNNMLRVCRTVEEFKPATIPFNENYNAIKYFYDKNLTQGNKSPHQLPYYQLYRGATLKQMDFYQLREGDFIELLGFISTSKNQLYTKKNFIRKKQDYLFIFTINSTKIPDHLKCFDHGFVDLAQYGIATTQFQAEEEVLLNALNIYRITKIISPQESPDEIGRVFLQYGAIFDLYQKDQKELTETEKSVLANYRFCIKEMNEIEDHGDVLMKAEQYDKCKQFYQEKIKHEEKAEYFNKLAEAHFHCGQTDDARQNAIKSLQKYEEELKNQAQIDKEKCAKIFEIHQKNMKILLEKQDSLNAKKAVNFEIQLIEQKLGDWILKAQKLMKRGEISFKEGNLIESQKDLKQSQRMILQKKNSYNIMREQIKSKYFFRNLCRCFFAKENSLSSMLEELQEVNRAEQELLKISDRVHQLLLNINECFLNVAEIVGDKKSYEECVKKGKQYFEQMPVKETENVFEKAKIKVIQAKVENAFQEVEHVEKSYGLMSEAIKMVEKIQPMHEKVGEYSNLLGLFHKKQFTKTMMLPTGGEDARKSIKSSRFIRQNEFIPARKIVPIQNQQENDVNQNPHQQEEQERIQEFNQQQYRQKYIQTKENFEKALSVITYHKTQNHPVVFQIRNHLGEVEYEYSNYRESKEQATIVLKTESGPKHSQGAKSALLIAKIHLSQGQIKQAFDNIEKSHQILRIALVKDPSNPKYRQILELSPIYMQIQLYKCKIYNRQMRHDLALSSIRNLRDIGRRKLKDADGVGYLADIYQEMGNILVCQGDTIKFEQYYEKAIHLREHEMGKYNIMNAICFCTIAKYLIFTNDMDTAQLYLSQAFQIFSRFAYNHPYFWIQLSTMAYLSQKFKNHQNQLIELRESVRLIQKRYSKNHINLMKMKVRYAEVLMKNNKPVEALPIFQNLSKQMEEDISLSKKQITFDEQDLDVDERDNEKVAIRNQVRKSMRQTQLRISESKAEAKIFDSANKTNQTPENDMSKEKFMASDHKLIQNISRVQIAQFNPDASDQEIFGIQE